MTDRDPHRPDQHHTKPATLRSRLALLPGARAAAAVFVAVLLVGGGTSFAMAKWNQSATATFSITAEGLDDGGDPATSAPVLVERKPTFAVRPAIDGQQSIDCAAPTRQALAGKDQAVVAFSWNRFSNATEYVVSVTPAQGINHQSLVTQPSSGRPTLAITFPRVASGADGNPLDGASATAEFYRNYILRIQPMNGDIPGDAIYTTYAYEHWNLENCFHAAPAPPIGALTEVSQTTTGDSSSARTSTFTWNKASGATSYEVTLVSKDSPPGNTFGVEATVTGEKVILQFPAPGSNEHFYTDYTLRIQPRGNGVVGDPVYRTFQFHKNYVGIY